MGCKKSHCPSFLVTIDDADFTQKLRIPTDFTQYLDEIVPFVSLLRTSTSWRGWCVKVKYEEGNLFFRKGLSDFAEDYFLELGDSIIFKYKGDSQFYVEVYGKNGGLKELPSSKEKLEVEHKDGEANRGSDITDSDCDIFGLRECVKRKRRMAWENGSGEELRSSKAKRRVTKSHINVEHKCDEVNWERGLDNIRGSWKDDEPAMRRTAIENDETETPEPAFSIKEETPYFILSWKQEMKYQAKIPAKFLREVGEELSDIVFLEDPIGRIWCIGLRKADSGVWFQKDWEEFIEHQSIGDQVFLCFRYHGDSQFYVSTLSRISASEMMYLDDSGHQEEPNINKRCQYTEEDRTKSAYATILSCKKKRDHSLEERLNSRYEKQRRGDDQEKVREISDLGEANHDAQQESVERTQSIKPELVIIEDEEVSSDELHHERKRRRAGEEKAREISDVGEPNLEAKQGSEERTQSIEPEFVNIEEKGVVNLEDTEVCADNLPDGRKRKGDGEEKVRDTCLGELNIDAGQGSGERTQSIEPRFVIIEEKELNSDELPDERKRRQDDEEKAREISGLGETNQEAKQGSEKRTQSIEIINIEEIEVVNVEDREVSSDKLLDGRKRIANDEEKTREISGLGETNEKANQGSEEITQSIKPEVLNIEEKEVINIEDNEVSSDELPDGRKRRGDDEEKARDFSGLGESNQDAKQRSEERNQSIELDVVDIEEKEMRSDKLLGERKRRADGEEKAREIPGLGESNQEAKQGSEERTQSNNEMSSDELPDGRKRRGDDEVKAREISGFGETNQDAKQGSEEINQSVELEEVDIEENEMRSDELPGERKRRGDSEEKVREISGLGESNQEAKRGSEERNQSFELELVDIEEKGLSSVEQPGERKRRGDGEEKAREIPGLGESNQDSKQGSQDRTQSNAVEPESVNIEEKDVSSSDELPDDLDESNHDKQKIEKLSPDVGNDKAGSIESESVDIAEKEVSSDELPDDFDESNQDKIRNEDSSPFQGNETAGAIERESINIASEESPTAAKKNYYSTSLRRKEKKIDNLVARLASAFKSQHPFFVAIIWGSYLSKGCLHVPSSFTQTYLSKTPVMVKLVRDSKTWSVKCCSKVLAGLFTTGWMSFVQDTGLEEGDVCVFELTDPNATTMQVSIFRVIEDELTLI